MIVVVRASAPDAPVDPVYRAAMHRDEGTAAPPPDGRAPQYGLVRLGGADGHVVSRREFGDAESLVAAVEALRLEDASLALFEDARDDASLAPRIAHFRGAGDASDGAHVLTALTRRKTAAEADALCELGRCARYGMEARVGAARFRGIAARTGHRAFAHELALPHVRQMHYGLQRDDGLSVDLCHADSPRTDAWRGHLAHASESLDRAARGLARAGSSIGAVEDAFVADMALRGLTPVCRAVGCAGYRGCAALCGSDAAQAGEVLTLTADFVDARGDRALLRRLHRVGDAEYRGSAPDDAAVGPLPSWRRLAEQLGLDALHDGGARAGATVHPSTRAFVLSVVRLVGGHAVADLVGSSVKVVSDVSAVRARQLVS